MKVPASNTRRRNSSFSMQHRTSKINAIFGGTESISHHGQQHIHSNTCSSPNDHYNNVKNPIHEHDPSPYHHHHRENPYCHHSTHHHHFNQHQPDIHQAHQAHRAHQAHQAHQPQPHHQTTSAYKPFHQKPAQIKKKISNLQGCMTTSDRKLIKRSEASGTSTTLQIIPSSQEPHSSTTNLNNTKEYDQQVAGNKQLRKLFGNVSALNLAKTKFKQKCDKESPLLKSSPKLKNSPHLRTNNKFRNLAKRSVSSRSGVGRLSAGGLGMRSQRVSESSRVSSNYPSRRSSRISSSRDSKKDEVHVGSGKSNLFTNPNTSSKRFANYSKVVSNNSKIFASKSFSNGNSFKTMSRSLTDSKINSKIDRLTGNCCHHSINQNLKNNVCMVREVTF